ncbi:MAG: hypothetical protein DWQ07_19770 [Chloroflexi bacterium]|nr:MAG: hypothetical protein DWQ07_19770 [Chloroflexota bacterium]MBL1194322.1 hypothetical protein [Chloroflexota bacterium]NOH11612.1 hypothetical protein [Chloroflexota bacterium]
MSVINVNDYSSPLDLLRGYWQKAEPYQRRMYWLAAILILSGLVHIIPLILSGGELTGPVSFRKPVVFGISTGISLAATTWVMHYMPTRQRLGAILNWAIAIGFYVEVILIDMQTWRGVPSHFNFSTAFDSAVFGTMGFFINVVGLAILVLTVMSFIWLKGSPTIKWAIRIGLILLLVSQVFGNLIVSNGVPRSIDFETGEYAYNEAAPPSIYDLSGLMKLPHFFAMHGIQTLPALALLMFFTGWDERRRMNTLLIAALGYIALTTIVTVQVFRGLAPFDLDTVSLAMHLLSLVLIGLPFLLALPAAMRKLPQGIVATD